MGKRIGIFLTLVGVFSSILFVASVQAEKAVIQWLFFGAFSTALGIFLWVRGREKPSSGRFRGVRKLMSKEGEGEGGQEEG